MLEQVGTKYEALRSPRRDSNPGPFERAAGMVKLYQDVRLNFHELQHWTHNKTC